MPDPIIHPRFFVALAAAAGLAGCGQGNGSETEPAAPAVEQTPSPPMVNHAVAATPKSSIMRPTVLNEVGAVEPEPAPEPFRATVPFDEGGTELSDAAKAVLARAVEAAAAAPDDRIMIRGHTDSRGDDEANLRVSTRRAEAARDYLVEQGVAEERMTVIGLGETRPVAPNALLNGEDNEEGRRRNRRVEIVIEPVPAAEPSASAPAGSSPPQPAPEPAAQPPAP